MSRHRLQPIPARLRQTPLRRRPPRPPLLTALALALTLFTSPLHAALVMDESGHTLTTGVVGPTAGRLYGFEFTTPSGPSFLVGEIKGSWRALNGYSGNTNFRLYTRSGSNLTSISTNVPITGIPDVNNNDFDFATHATTIDFSSQSISLDPNTAYVIAGEHNGGGGHFGIHLSYSAGSGPIPGAGRIYGTVALDDAGFEDQNDMTFQIFDAAPVPEPASPLLLLISTILFLTRRSHTPSTRPPLSPADYPVPTSRHRLQPIPARSRQPLFLTALTLAFAIFTSPLHAALIMDESSHSPTSSAGEGSGGELTGFEFTTPSGPSFIVGEIKASFFDNNGYSGNTDFRLYTRSGSDLTPISTPVSIAGIPSVTPATFNFATHATTIDFSSQSISLDPNSAYVLLAEHNGGAGNMGTIFAFGAGSGPIVGAGRIQASVALDDAGFEDHNDIIFQIFDTPPVPEPTSLLLFIAASTLLLTRRPTAEPARQRLPATLHNSGRGRPKLSSLLQ